MLIEPVTSVKHDLIEDLFGETQRYVRHFFEHVDLAAIKKLFAQLQNSSGTIFLTGVGKSGIIAKKIAATMSSSGTKAHYLSPLNALHGDIGAVSKDDTILLMSKSGETDELLHLCPILRNKGANLIAIVSNIESRLAKACDISICLPVARELCPFDMVPTTSTLVQLIFGDLLAIALMRAKNFSVDDFAQNHPAGRLGKRMTFTVHDLMLTGDFLPLAYAQDQLVNVLVELTNKKCGCVIITNDERHLLGIFTDGDLRRSLQKHGATALHKSMDEIMTKTPRFIHSQMLAFDAMKFMEADQKRPITVLPVVDDQKVVGIIKMHDIVQSGI
jgi:arabinose-5-phosphate isomerase